jgi:hypothetical protein
MHCQYFVADISWMGNKMNKGIRWNGTVQGDTLAWDWLRHVYYI